MEPAKEKNTWVLVPKPRSAIKTIQWFPALMKVDGSLWNKKDENNEHPVRREYLQYAHPFDEFNDDDPEVNARMEFARYQTLGLAYLDECKVESERRLIITPAGKELVSSNNKEEVILRQLLKWQFPSNIHSSSSFSPMKVFPLEVVIHVLEYFKTINRLDATFLFFCNSKEEILETIEKIKKFRNLIIDEPANKHREILINNFDKINGYSSNKPETYLDYTDVLFRHLEYTSIFETSGRGDFLRLYVPERAIIKFNQLSKNYDFSFFEDYNDKEKFYSYFGDPFSKLLPWENAVELFEIIESKVALLGNNELAVEVSALSNATDMHELKSIESKLDSEILDKNEREFINVISKTAEERGRIIQKFKDIESGDEDLSALWLEVNTWKSLVAMDGTHHVKRNFKIELDLTPRSFASGTNNTPDMEFYNQKYILIPEVSIQSGVQQWITEGSSVVEHVSKFLEIKNGKKFIGFDAVEKYMNKDNVKAIYGFFLCKKINKRLLWQFYVLNREAWLGEPVAVIPMEISEYISILDAMYKNNISALNFEKMIEEIAQTAKSSENYNTWKEKQSEIVSAFINEPFTGKNYETVS